MLVIKINDRIREVAEREIRGPVSDIKIISGFRERRSGSSTSPGAGWRPVPGQKRSWIKMEPRYEMLSVSTDEVIETEGWPVGAERFKFIAKDYEEIVAPLVRAGVNSMGAIGVKKAPEIISSVITEKVKEAGLALPTDLEMEEIVLGIWERNHSVKRVKIDVFHKHPARGPDVPLATVRKTVETQETKTPETQPPKVPETQLPKPVQDELPKPVQDEPPKPVQDGPPKPVQDEP